MPTANVAPGLWVDVKLVTAQLSEADGAVQVTAALQSPASLVCVMSSGVLAMAGASSSVMLMSKLAVAVLPAASIAVKVTVVVPSGKVSTLCMDVKDVTPQLSLAEGATSVSNTASKYSHSTTAPH